MKKMVIAAGIVWLGSWPGEAPAADPFPAELVPARTFAVVRIADFTRIDAEFRSLGLPTFSSHLASQGLTGDSGLDFQRPWYFLWAEDSLKKEFPYILMPLSNPEAFGDHLARRQTPEPNFRVHRGHAILGVFPLPELGGNHLVGGFTGSIEGKADLRTLRRVYADEIQVLRTTFRESPAQGREQVPTDDPLPGMEAAALAGMLQAQIDLLFGFLEQSEDLTIFLDLAAGKLDLAVKWSLGSGTPWGKLVAGQKPKVPSGLGRVDLNAALLSWASFDLSRNFEVLEPVSGNLGNSMMGMDPDLLLELMKRQGEFVMAGGFGPEGMEVEGIYSLTGARMEEFRGLVRNLMTGDWLRAPGFTVEYKQKIGKVAGMEVDQLVQEFSGTEAEENPHSMNWMEIYYGWGKKEMVSVVRMGSKKKDWVDHLQDLASHPEIPLPGPIREVLAGFPKNLLVFAWIDLSMVFEGFGNSFPGYEKISFPGDFPPLGYYVTAHGPQLEFGGSVDLRSLMAAVMSWPRPEAESGADEDEP